MRDLVLPKISVIIPTLNEEKYLPNALASLAKLNYPGQLYEIILVDNGSTDRTLAIAQDHDIDIYVDAEKTVAGLRNLGASQATGDLLAFLDADCSVTEDWLLEAAKYYHKTGIVAWGSPAQIPPNATWVQKTWYLVRQKARDIQEVDWLESMNVFIRRTDFWRVRGFKEELATCEDVDLSYRLQNYGQIISDNRIKVTHTGEAATIREFFKKEVWRGKNNLKGPYSHGFSLKEAWSLSIPLYFGLLLSLFFLLFILSGHLFWFALWGLLIICPTMMVLIKTRLKAACSLQDLLRLSLLLQVYFFSRTIAVLR